jgi:2-octaprenylphenol hydroxylase
MTGFRHLFASRNPLLVLARNIGLTATDRLLPLKQELARLAMGLGGDLPAAARATAVG